MTEKWKEQMRRKLDLYSEPAPEVSWTDLEKALHRSGKTRRIPAFIYYASAAAAALLLGAVLLLRVPDKDKSDMVAVIPGTSSTVTEPQVIPDDVASASNEDFSAIGDDSSPSSTDNSGNRSGVKKQSTAIASNSLLADSRDKNDNTVGQVTEPAEEETFPSQVSSPEEGNAVVSGESAQEKEDVSSGDKVKEDSNVPTGPYVRTRDPFSVVDDHPKNRRRRSLTAMAFVGNTPGGFGKMGTYDAALPMADSYGGTDKLYMSSNSKSGSNSTYVNSPDINSDVDHRQPVRAGLRLRYALDENWGIESGLTYSYLHSDISTGAGGLNTSYVQRLSYIGIPVNVTRYLWSGNRFAVYASAGGMVEKMVKGRRELASIVNGNSDVATTEKVKIGPLQYSVNGAVGFEYRIWDAFGLYAEPSLDYHFDNGSPVPTIYSDKPLRFGISIGMRFNLGER